ncbi:J domain-containing protein [Fodinibacter luteus]
MSPANPYAILGVPEDASAEEIKKAYRRQMRLAAVDIHPDVSDAERDVLQERMVEVNWAFESLTGSRREALDADLRRQRVAEAAREQRLKHEQARQAAAWQAAQRRAHEAEDRERVAQAWREAARERERLQRVRRQAEEHARRTAQRRRDDERRYREAAWVREFTDGGTGFREEVRFDGPVVTEQLLNELWELFAPRPGQDVHETIEVTRDQWASGAVWTSGIDGLPLVGLEHSGPATYCFRGRGMHGVYGGPRGDHYVTVVHVDEFGQPVLGGFRAPDRRVPIRDETAEPPVERAGASRGRPGPLAVAGTALRLVGTLLKWALIVLAGLAAVLLVLVVVLAFVAARG